MAEPVSDELNGSMFLLRDSKPGDLVMRRRMILGDTYMDFVLRPTPGSVLTFDANLRPKIDSLADLSGYQAMVEVPNDETRLALTAEYLRNGSRVFVLNTGKYWDVIDLTELPGADAFIRVAQTATDVGADPVGSANAAQSAAIAAAASDATTKANAAQADAIAASIPLAQKAAVNGVASLDADTKLPAAQLPDAIDARIQVLSGTDAALATEVLALGEIAAPTDGAWLRKGDGVTAGGVKIGDLSALNATNLTSGTVPEARIALPTNSTTVSGICREILYSSNVTATYGYNYVAISTSTTTRTFTDPAAAQSSGWYTVLSPRASVVIGGLTYPPQSTPIFRQYDIVSEVWRTRATFCPVPASASASGQVGDMSYDATYFYICTATNTWKRVAIATW